MTDCESRRESGECADDAAALVGGGDWAGVVAAEDAITVAGDLGVDEFFEAAGGEADGGGDDGPGLGEEAESVGEGVGAVGDGAVGEEDDTFGIGWGVVAGEELLAEGGFEGDEAEDGVGVAADEEADGAVAEGADAVEEEDGMVYEERFVVLDEIGGFGWHRESPLGLLYWFGCLEN
jgi:hypothetical protein